MSQKLDSQDAGRKAALARRRKFMIMAPAAVVLLGALVAAAWWYANLPPAPAQSPKVFVSLELRELDAEPRHTWSAGLTLSGDVETQLAGQLKSKGFEVVEALEPDTVATLYDSGRLEPPLATIADATGATMAALGSVRCRSQGPVFDTGMVSVMSGVRLRLLEIASKAIVSTARADAAIIHVDAAKACAKATDKALAKVLSSFGEPTTESPPDPTP